MRLELLSAAWATYRKKVVPAGAGHAQVEGSRLAFYAGAGTLFSILLSVLEPGLEPTEADLARVSDLNEELQKHLRDLRDLKQSAEGSAGRTEWFCLTEGCSRTFVSEADALEHQVTCPLRPRRSR